MPTTFSPDADNWYSSSHYQQLGQTGAGWNPKEEFIQIAAAQTAPETLTA